MRLHGKVCSVAISALLPVVLGAGALRAGEAAGDWLRRTGKDLEIRLRGEVLDPDGHAATGLTMTGGLITVGGNRSIEPKVEGHRFEVWVPLNQVTLYGAWLKAASADGTRVAWWRVQTYELRQAALDGIQMTLRAPTRWVEVQVTEAGRPVPGAQVKAELEYGVELRAKTDADGIARLGLLPQQKLIGLMAWTGDHRIGGYGFSRTPARDPEANRQVVELSKCRDQKVRFVDEGGKPVPGVAFVLQVATAPPDFNFIGTFEHAGMATDMTGEAIYRWFPDWDKHFYYAELRSHGWVIDGDKQTIDGVAVFKLKKSMARKRVHGRVVSTTTGVAGFFVTLQSFEGESEHMSDVVSAFTDSEGGFSVDVLPDATYCAYALDARWVGEIIDFVPYQSASDKVTSPELPVREGEKVEVVVTSGPQKKPYPNVMVCLGKEHEYTWRENGRTRHGIGGPRWWVTTDESGRATTYALPGKLKAAIHTQSWQTIETVEVGSAPVTRIALHRQVEAKRKVTGRLVFAKGLKADLEGAEIRIGAVDGHCGDRRTLKAGRDGSFSLETLAAELGVFGCTRDGRAAGWRIVKDLESPIEIELRPTMDYQGRLLGVGDRPLVGHGVAAIARVEGERDYDVMAPKSFEAKRIDAKTDAQGNFRIVGVPCEMKVEIQADAMDGSQQGKELDEVYLEPGESRPLAVSRLAKASNGSGEIPLTERYRKTLRDCGLAGFHAMVIISGAGESVGKFVKQNLVDYETNEDIAAFMQIVVASDANKLGAADRAFLKERKWQLPGEGHVAAHALDAKGERLGGLELAVADKAAVEAAAAFVHRYAPARPDAEKKWQEAFAEAKRSHRRVWVRISQRYCGPCFLLARWLDDHREVLEKDYVLLKIDDYRDQKGARVAGRVTRGKPQGIPFYAIFDCDEKMLVDSEGPLGNIGFPSSFDDKKQLRKMLISSRQKLTDAEIDRLLASLGE